MELGQLCTFVVLKRSGLLCAELETENRAWARGSLIFTALLWGAGLYFRARTQQRRRDSVLALWWRYSGCGQERCPRHIAGGKKQNLPKRRRGQSWVSNLVKEFGWCPVGSGSLRTV